MIGSSQGWHGWEVWHPLRDLRRERERRRVTQKDLGERCARSCCRYSPSVGSCGIGARWLPCSSITAGGGLNTWRVTSSGSRRAREILRNGETRWLSTANSSYLICAMTIEAICEVTGLQKLGVARQRLWGS